jgi:uncharacterized protein
MSQKRRPLQLLFDQVAARSAALTLAHPGWPCARGCGACCRSLARVPELSRAEWLLIEAALDALPNAQRSACVEQAHALQLRDQDQRCQCPLFDQSGEICRIYEARPLACRTYGYYAGRSHDAWCDLVERHVTDARDRLVLGNLDASEAELARQGGERRSLLAWLAEYENARGTNVQAN